MVPVSAMPICPICIDITDNMPTTDTPLAPQQPKLILKQPHTTVGVKGKPLASCDECGTLFRRGADIKRHKDDVHRQLGKHYKCYSCDAMRTRKDKMKEHCRKHHGHRYGAEQFREEDD